MKEPSIHFRKGIETGIYGRHEEAAQCFAQRHEQGDVECSAELAICYRVGAGVSCDFNEFYRLARELEQKDCPLAHCLLASAYADGLGCRGDYEKAESHLTRWAKVSEAPMPGISEECRLRMRAIGLSDAMEQYMEQAQTEDGTVPCIDFMQAIREYAPRVLW
ncbi:MAG: sel1 repeat family protein [Akkermansia sp.]|nr:sel1 repeat family protein [Akkermansia sp.]